MIISTTKTVSAGHLALLALLFVLGGCESATSESADAAAGSEPARQDSRLLIIGQDLGAIRGYMASGCCAEPDALTAYLDFYDLLTDKDFGGLGINANGDELDFELSWGAGAVSAYKTANEFGVSDIAIGLSLTENDHPGELGNIGEGAHDDKIRQLARFAAMIDGHIYLRIGYEFDGAWNHGYDNQAEYIAAYRRIVDVLRAEGADNIDYVLQASAAGIDEILDRRHEDLSGWYPGDDYVDWLALSWFMNPDERSVQQFDDFAPKTPGQLAAEVIDLAREKGKPVMIAEASPQGFDLNERFTAHHHAFWDGESASGQRAVSDDEIWDYWFAPTFALLNDNRDVIKALAYINVDWDSQPMWGPPYPEGFWGDTRLETNAEIANRFNDAVSAWKSGE